MRDRLVLLSVVRGIELSQVVVTRRYMKGPDLCRFFPLSKSPRGKTACLKQAQYIVELSQVGLQQLHQNFSRVTDPQTGIGVHESKTRRINLHTDDMSCLGQTYHDDVASCSQATG